MSSDVKQQPLFLHTSESSQAAYRAMMAGAADVLVRHYAGLEQPYSGLGPEVLTTLIDNIEVCPEEEGMPIPELLELVGSALLRHSAVVTDPLCIAHLHCPPLMPALAAEALIAASNQSMDSWDQSMAATLLEEKLIRWLNGLFGYGQHADGVFTSGGTQSNFMGVMLARDHYALERWGWNVQQQGLPPEAGKLRLLCSEEAHFSVKQAASLLGLGHQAVVPVKTDADKRMCPERLDETIGRLLRDGLHPFAIVATAGTTDYAAVDPLAAISKAAVRHGLWLHVDAAYGGALALSSRYSGLLDGIGHADSITVDFHKLFFQPISCGAFLLRDKRRFRLLRLTADYLNPEDEEEAGLPNLVVKSVQTTRRFDALKLYMSLKHLGRRQFGELIDSTIRTAKSAAEMISRESCFTLMAEPVINTVVFAYRPQLAEGPERRSFGQATVSGAGRTAADQLNLLIRERLLAEGAGVIARTKSDGRICLKLTILNPLTGPQHISALLERIRTIGWELETGIPSGKETVAR
ncbi:pyridoxal phosphate-dependent decarboxylase family protein [Paenibacillus tarimensis]|nr:aspartate aminotransferase family protein [Paenibacillus tarimensis]MCF2945085.1 aspartate aminotransferase family protein [Paenibacillus tarimensis]